MSFMGHSNVAELACLQKYRYGCTVCLGWDIKGIVKYISGGAHRRAPLNMQQYSKIEKIHFQLLRYSIFGQISGMVPFPFFQVDQWPMGPYSTKPASLEAGKGEVPHKTFETFISLQPWCPLFLGVAWKGQGVTWQCMKS